MKDLLSKEHYSYKIHTLLMESRAYRPFYREPPYMNYPPFLQESLDSPSMTFQKSQPPLQIRRGSSHYDISCKIANYSKSSISSF